MSFFACGWNYYGVSGLYSGFLSCISKLQKNIREAGIIIAILWGGIICGFGGLCLFSIY